VIPVRQTKNGDDANCYAACLASIFEVSLEEVPQPTSDDCTFEAWQRYNARIESQFLAPRGFRTAEFGALTGDTGELAKPRGYSILTVESFGFAGAHAVVCFDGEVVWNPLPGGETPGAAPICWTIFVALDPARLERNINHG